MISLLLKNTLYLSLSVSVCLCISICLFVSLRLGHCYHQMISFQKIYGLYGREHHILETNVALGGKKKKMLPQRRTNEQVKIGLLNSVNGRCETEFRNHDFFFSKYALSFFGWLCDDFATYYYVYSSKLLFSRLA